MLRGRDGIRIKELDADNIANTSSNRRSFDWCNQMICARQIIYHKKKKHHCMFSSPHLNKTSQFSLKKTPYFYYPLFTLIVCSEMQPKTPDYLRLFNFDNNVRCKQIIASPPSICLSAYTKYYTIIIEYNITMLSLLRVIC